jgi:hypothetical protein
LYTVTTPPSVTLITGGRVDLESITLITGIRGYPQHLQLR